MSSMAGIEGIVVARGDIDAREDSKPAARARPIMTSSLISVTSPEPRLSTSSTLLFCLFLSRFSSFASFERS